MKYAATKRESRITRGRETAKRSRAYFIYLQFKEL